MDTRVTVYNWNKRNLGNAKQFDAALNVVMVQNPEPTCSLDVTDTNGKTLRLHFAQKDFFAFQEKVNDRAKRIVDIVNNK